MQIQSPKSTIPILRARSRVPSVPFVPCVPDVPFVPCVPDVPFVPDVRDVSDVSVVRDVSDVSVVRDVSDVSDVSANARSPKRNRTPRNAECRVGGPRVSKGSSSNSKCETFYHPVRRSGVHPSLSRRGAFGIGNSQKLGLNTRSRFTRFKCFRCFISFMRFNRFSNTWPL